MASVKLVSINIERSKHLERVEQFLNGQLPDVVCLQELCERDIPRIESIMNAPCIYTRVASHPADSPEEGVLMTGIGICTRLPVRSHAEFYYVGDAASAAFPMHRPAIRNKPLLVCEIESDSVLFRVATTHFTWTPDGTASDAQRDDMANLLNILSPLKEVALCGDFNAPRGGEIFGMLAERYVDNIPSAYTTSIDKELHRAGDLQLMVDGLFTTPGYSVSKVQLHAGVSDHCAIAATVNV